MSQLETKEAGLFWGAAGAAVPLEGVKVRAEIVGHGSRVIMAQRFRNVEKVPIEAVYIFPVPEAAAVCGLAIRVGERRIEGEVTERDKAFDAYDDAMAAGHGAALLDSERPNIFTMSVGNILPGQETIVELTWVAELPAEGDAIRFVLPTTVAPRYAPREDQQGVSPTPAERVSPPVQLEVPYGLELDVEVALSSAVGAVESPSHPIRVTTDGVGRAHVTLSHATAAMDRDFVLLVTPREAGRPRVLVERNEDGLATAAVSFVPQVPTGATPPRKEVVFLVDRSGSMEGTSIEQVRAALHLCLRSLRPGDLFNIVGFGSTFTMLFPRSAAYDQATLDEASAHVDGLDADLGGTEILPALRAVLHREPAAGAARQVVILTDGEVTNEAAVVELAEQHRQDTRIFTFGIGYGASEHLVRSLARVTKGEAEFIHPGERIEPKVLRQFSRLGAPALRDVKVTWEGAEPVLRAPHRPPTIFSGEASIAYARFAVAAVVTATLSATWDGTPVEWKLAVDAVDAGSGNLLATLAARAAIRDLEEGTSALHDKPRGSAQAPRRRDERVKEAILQLATSYRLASSETSFVAIERRDVAGDQPAAELRRVPVALTRGWGGVETRTPAFSQAAPSMPLRLAGMPAAALRDATYLASVTPSAATDADNCACALPEPPRSARSNRKVAFAVSPSPPDAPHVALARLQRADGSWRLDVPLCGAIGVKVAVLSAAAKTVGSGDHARAVVATLAAVRFLEKNASDVRDEWRLLAQKAEQWLERALASGPADIRQRLESLIAALL